MHTNLEMIQLAKKAAEGCVIKFQDGQFLGQGCWYDLTGNGVESLQELLEEFQEVGLEEFNRQFAPVFEKQVASAIEHHDQQFQELLPRVRGTPYDSREIEALQARGQDTSELVTTEDYRATQGVRDHFIGLLKRYQRGEPVSVNIPNGPPHTYASEVIIESYAVGRFPNGTPVVLQKPGVPPQPASHPAPWE